MLVLVWLVVLGIYWTAHIVTAQGMGSLIVHFYYTSTTTDWVWTDIIIVIAVKFRASKNSILY